jgi:predicted AAA+ superfamily ATPase
VLFYNPSVTSDSNHKSIESSVSNILRDIEQLIENMEKNQAKQNENMLKNVKDLLGNILAKQQSSRPVSVMPNKSTTPVIDTNPGMNYDVRNFVSEHIPDLLGQVTNELIEQTPVSEILSNPQMSRPVSATSNRNDVYAKSRSPEIINDGRKFLKYSYFISNVYYLKVY